MRDVHRWYIRRDGWRRDLHPGRWPKERRDIVELGGRAASCLWAEAESPRYSIAERFRRALADARQKSLRSVA